VSLRPIIAIFNANIDAEIAVELEAAMSEISRLDSRHGTHLEAITALLLRTESVASSEIELEASVDDYARTHADDAIRARSRRWRRPPP
jgi:hypothetical protein